MRFRMSGSVLVAGTLAACTLPPVDDGSASCGPSIIARESTGETFDSFADAIESAHTDDAFCVGAGTYTLESAALQHKETGPYAQSLTIRGAGSADTLLVAAEGYETLLYVEIAGALRVEGVTISGGRVRLQGDEVALSDVAFRDYAGWKRGLSLEGDVIEVDGLEISDNQMDYASGLYASAVVSGSFSDLDLHDNRSAAGYLAELHGPMSVRNSRIAANDRSDEQPGYDLMELFGPSTVDDVVFEDNHFNGPVLRAYESLSATGLVLTGNATGFAAALALMGPTTLCDARIVGNSAPDGALGLYDDASVALDSVNSHVDAGSNAPCDLSGRPCADQSCAAQCLDAALGDSEPAWCDAFGCE
jgi:hypothetical protein